MSDIRILFIVTAAVTIVVLVRMLRRSRLRERYAGLWLLLSAVVIVLGVFPVLLNDLAHAIGVAEPPNLLFFAACVVLLLVSVGLSVELSTQEDRTRALAEEVAMLRAQLDDLVPDRS